LAKQAVKRALEEAKKARVFNIKEECTHAPSWKVDYVGRRGGWPVTEKGVYRDKGGGEH